MRSVHYLLISAICWAMVFGAPVCSEAVKTDFYLQWNATFAPPHNDPVVGDRVARYRVQVEPNLEIGWLRYRLRFNAWGVNRWQSVDKVGGGLDSWSNSDWSVEKWRLSLLHQAEFGPKSIHLFVEYYQPIDSNDWKGHGLETHYYMLTGIGGIFW
jgi:hypothetical protein